MTIYFHSLLKHKYFHIMVHKIWRTVIKIQKKNTDCTVWAQNSTKEKCDMMKDICCRFEIIISGFNWNVSLVYVAMNFLTCVIYKSQESVRLSWCSVCFLSLKLEIYKCRGRYIVYPFVSHRLSRRTAACTGQRTLSLPLISFLVHDSSGS
jgi:hypothetical protein